MKKKLVIIISIIVIALASISAISYSIATLGNPGAAGKDGKELAQLGAPGDAADATTNIDVIIEKSITEGENFNIVEIYADGNGPSSLSTYIKDANAEYFKQYVMDAHSTKNPQQQMAPGKIVLDQLPVSSAITASTVVQNSNVLPNPGFDVDEDGNQVPLDATYTRVINNADLIYVYCPDYNAFDGMMADGIYELLRIHSVGKKRPIIIDYVRPGESKNSGKTYADLAKVIAPNNIRYRTFQWRGDATAQEFFSRSKSSYIRFDTNQRTPTKKVLVITEMANGVSAADYVPAEGTMQKKFQDVLNSDDGKDLLDNYVYFGNNVPKPDEIEFVPMSPKDVTAAVINAGGYDFILMENNLFSANGEYEDPDNPVDIPLMNQTDSDGRAPVDVYEALKTASESGQYIIYDYDVPVSSGDSSNSGYVRLKDILTYEDGSARYPHVFPSSYNTFDDTITACRAIAGGTATDNQNDKAKDTGDRIADIINKGVYRNSDDDGSKDKKYRVLEIQPCYPIDLELAKTKKDMDNSKYTNIDGIKGSYYNDPNNIVYGNTKEEITEGTEYYAFEMSKAKIAHALNLAYDDVEVEQMSVNELISSKEVVVEYYDMVYIGGDISAFVPYNVFNYSGGDTANYEGGYDNNFAATKILTSFDMYTHTGNFLKFEKGTSGLFFGNIGDQEDNNIEYTGHDLSTIKRDELMRYVDAGLPIVIDSAVAKAFEESYQYDPSNPANKNSGGNRLSQLALHNIDPDSNMYQFLAYAYEAERNNGQDGKHVAINWGDLDAKADGTTRTIDNANRNYGPTRGDTVTVYSKDVETMLKNLKDNGSTRPQLTLTQKPKNYEQDKANYNTDRVAVFKAGIKSGDPNETYTISLYIDVNLDGYYSDNDSERVAVMPCAIGSEVEITYDIANKLGEDFFGLLNWKIKVTDSTGTMCDMRQGSSVFKLKKTAKKEVRVLQISPLDRGDNQALGGMNALYFCTDCQMANRILDKNVVVHGTNHFIDPGMNSDVANYGEAAKYETVTIGGQTFSTGRHEHDFGIVQYDVDKELDDWYINLAESLTHDDPEGKYDPEKGDFDIDIDIITEEEFDALCATTAGRDSDAAIKAGIQSALTTYAAKHGITGIDFSQMTQQDVNTLCGANGANSGEIAELVHGVLGNVFGNIGLKHSIHDTRGIAGMLDKPQMSDAFLVGLLLDEAPTDTVAGWYENAYNDWMDSTKPTGSTLYGANGLAKTLEDAIIAYTNRLVQQGGGSYMNEYVKKGVLGEGGVPAKWMIDRQYYKFFSYINENISNNQSLIQNTAGTERDDVVKAYKEYYAAYDNVLDWKDDYKLIAQQNDDDTEWLINSYDMLILGLSDRFNDKDLEHASAVQIKNYIDAGGSLLNTHDTMTRYASVGAVEMTKVLRESFGMDRFHVTGVATGASGSVGSISFSNPERVEKTVTVKIVPPQDYMPAATTTCTYKDRNINMDMSSGGNQWNTTVGISQQSVSLSEPTGTDPVKLIVNFRTNPDTDGKAPCKIYADDVELGTVNAAGRYEFNLPANFSGSYAANYDFTEAKNYKMKASLAADGTLTFSDVTMEDYRDGQDKMEVEIDFSGSATPIANNTIWKLSIFNRNYDGTVSNGKVTFTNVDRTVATFDGTDSKNAAPTRYRRYNTKDNSKYFWTERLQALDYAGYANIENDPTRGKWVRYNAPVGVTDFFVANEARSHMRSLYKYALTSSERYDQGGLNVNGTHTQTQYGTTTAKRVNEGGVTSYPFLITGDLQISPTHAQYHALDMEDTNVAVWYTLAANNIDPGDAAVQSSSMYVASPRDGMNNYFIYSRNNVYYCGVGHTHVTGPKNSNNDERRLFINVIVNSVSKGKISPSLRLYNRCDKADGNCEHNYVDPTKDADNKKLSKELNTLFYNKNNPEGEMYQYNVADADDDIYPIFDLTAFEGASAIKELRVFWDLDFDPSDAKSYMWDTNTANHKEIVSYLNSTYTGGTRVRLRDTNKKLKLEQEYLDAYGGNYTYIVVYAKDQKGIENYARVKITLLPHLFDLTDAEFDYQHRGITASAKHMDITDKAKFDI